MKIRTDYVSNSSSSSFIVIAGEPQPYDYKYYEPWLLSCENGCHEFGWQVEKYNDFWSKLNWCAIMIGELQNAKTSKWYDEDPNDVEYTKNRKAKCRKLIAKSDEYLEILKEVCKNEFNMEIRIRLDEDILDAYIDHQSGPFENEDNLGMFESYYALHQFLASPDSYIQCDNDNH